MPRELTPEQKACKELLTIASELKKEAKRLETLSKDWKREIERENADWRGIHAVQAFAVMHRNRMADLLRQHKRMMESRISVNEQGGK